MFERASRRCNIYVIYTLLQGWNFLGYSRVRRFRFRSEINKDGVEVHSACDLSPFRTRALPSPTHGCAIGQLTLFVSRWIGRIHELPMTVYSQTFLVTVCVHTPMHFAYAADMSLLWVHVISRIQVGIIFVLINLSIQSA